VNDPNLDQPRMVAERLRPLLPEIVFVGGCATGLLITDQGAAPVRMTYDVDVIAEIVTYAGYTRFSERLRRLGFEEDAREGAPICRWRHQDLTLDVMPLDEKILGFSNRWYRDALHAAVEIELAHGLTVRAISAPYFMVTKMEAFKGRGRDDFFASHDLEDFISVVDGRPSLLNEVAASPTALRNYLRDAIKLLLKDSRFLDALPGYLLPDDANQARISLLTRRLQALSSLKSGEI
jgi:hypothetical protein